MPSVDLNKRKTTEQSVHTDLPPTQVICGAVKWKGMGVKGNN